MFDAAWLRARIGSLKPSPKTGELYLTELVELARADGRVVVALTVDDDGRLLGINDRAELAQAEWDMRTRINAAHMIAGVTMRDPSTVYVDAGVTLAPDVTIEPNVILRGATSVGEGSDDRRRQPDRRQHDRRGLPRLGERRRVVDDRGRRQRRAVQPPPAGLGRRAPRRGRQLRRAEERPPRARASSSTT